MEIKKEGNKAFQGLIAGDITMYEELFHRYYRPLCLFALTFKISKEESEEIVQDVLLQMWYKREDFVTEDKMRGFLYISTRNATFNLLDKVKRFTKNQDDYSKETSYAYNKHMFLAPEQHQAVVYAETVQYLHQTIQKLPEQCAKIMVMLYIDGMTVAEIMEELDIAASTVYAQKTKGISLLRSYLKTDEYFIITLLIAGYFNIN